MTRPKVILNCFASIDGRLTTAPGKNVAEWTATGLDAGANVLTHQLYDELGCDCLLGGSESILVFGSHYVPLETPVPMPEKLKKFIIIDGRGRIDWSYYDKSLLVITREDVPERYLHKLREKGIDFVQAGRGQHVDLERALVALYERGLRVVGLTGGGSVNGAFLRQGLVDEISIVYAPLAIGGRSTPTLFDGEDLQSLEDAVRLELIASSVWGNLVCAHYRVVGSEPGGVHALVE